VTGVCNWERRFSTGIHLRARYLAASVTSRLLFDGTVTATDMSRASEFYMIMHLGGCGFADGISRQNISDWPKFKELMKCMYNVK
jgi:hypothetical protein